MSLRHHPQVLAFAEAARSYCALIEAEPVDPVRWLRDVYTALAKVYAEAQPLSEFPYMESEMEIPKSMHLSTEEWGALFQRLQDFFGDQGIYCAYFDPTESVETREPPNMFTVGADLAEIYQDLVPGLRAWDTGDDQYLKAIFWDWTWGMENHWGRHATDAMRALWVLVHQYGFDPEQE